MYKLLVVDDEYEIRNGLCKYFPWDKLGFTVVGQADNGKQALKFCEENYVDIVLCDIRMPVMNGLEFSEELYKRKSKIKIVLLSAYRDFDFAQKAISFGVKNYIVKSTKFNQLIEAFNQIKVELDEELAVKVVGSEDTPVEKTDSDISSYNQRVIQSIKSYIDEHYRDVELKDLSEYINMNPYYISKFFKQNTNENFSDYLLKVRMGKAIELLKDIRYKVYEISDMLGYSNVKNFTRAFTQYYGKSPSAFRKNEDLDDGAIK